MKNAETRHILESEILRLRAPKKPLKQNEFDEYYNCLKRLCGLNCIYALEQEKIYSCTHGNLNDFVSEFLEYTSPMIHRMGKEIIYKNVRLSRTDILFSPRLTEIALGNMMGEFLSIGNTASVSVFQTRSGVAVCVSGKEFQNSEHILRCIRHIAKLHGGRCVVSFCEKQKKIALALPFFPKFQPLKLVPCSTELCRLCNI